MNEASASLMSNWSALRDQWSITRGHWRDSAGDQFERDFWKQIEQETPQLLRSIDNLNSELDSALRNT